MERSDSRCCDNDTTLIAARSSAVGDEGSERAVSDDLGAREVQSAGVRRYHWPGQARQGTPGGHNQTAGGECSAMQWSSQTVGSQQRRPSVSHARVERAL